MSSRSSVYVHQGSSASSASSPSRPSSSASYESSNSRSVSNRREYDAAGHAAQVIRSAKTVVINHNRKDFEKDSPSPRYGGGYQ